MCKNNLSSEVQNLGVFEEQLCPNLLFLSKRTLLSWLNVTLIKMIWFSGNISQCLRENINIICGFDDILFYA